MVRRGFNYGVAALFLAMACLFYNSRVAVAYGAVRIQAAMRAQADAAFLADWQHLRDLDPTADSQDFVVVDIASQQLYLFEDGMRVATWAISTGLRGTGEREGSFQTPLGAFEIVEKIGAGLPEYAVLNDRGASGGIASPVFTADDVAASDLITTRILVLEGLQPGWNEDGDVDTLARHVYIHGTPNLGMLGRPASLGCVQMAPGAMITLFHAVHPDTLVLITPGTGNLAEIPGSEINVRVVDAGPREST